MLQRWREKELVFKGIDKRGSAIQGDIDTKKFFLYSKDVVNALQKSELLFEEDEEYNWWVLAKESLSFTKETGCFSEVEKDWKMGTVQRGGNRNLLWHEGLLDAPKSHVGYVQVFDLFISKVSELLQKGMRQLWKL